MRARVYSPTYLGGMIRRNDVALVDPARLGWGLRSAVEALGADVHDHTPVTAVYRKGSRLEIRIPNGRVLASRAVMATNAYHGPVRRPPSLHDPGVRPRLGDRAALRRTDGLGRLGRS